MVSFGSLFMSLSIILCVELQTAFTQNQFGRTNDVTRTSSQTEQLCPPGSCPPAWIGLLNEYSWMLSDSVLKPLCSSALKDGFIDNCNAPNHSCGKANTSGVKFCCCPAHQLSKVQDCLPRSQNICVPDTFAPWQSKLQDLIFSLMG